MENINPIMTGFVYQHKDGTYTIWNVEVTEEDQCRIEEVLSNYETSGISVKGSLKELNLMEVF